MTEPGIVGYEISVYGVDGLRGALHFSRVVRIAEGQMYITLQLEDGTLHLLRGSDYRRLECRPQYDREVMQ